MSRSCAVVNASDLYFVNSDSSVGFSPGTQAVFFLHGLYTGRIYQTVVDCRDCKGKACDRKMHGVSTVLSEAQVTSRWFSVAYTSALEVAAYDKAPNTHAITCIICDRARSMSCRGGRIAVA